MIVTPGRVGALQPARLDADIPLERCEEGEQPEAETLGGGAQVQRHAVTSSDDWARRWASPSWRSWQHVETGGQPPTRRRADLGVGTEQLAFGPISTSDAGSVPAATPSRTHRHRDATAREAFGRVNGGATFRTSITPPGRLPRLTVMRSGSPSFGSGPIMPATSSHSRARAVSPGGRSRGRPSSPSSRTALRRVGTARSSRTCSRPDRGDVATLSSS